MTMPRFPRPFTGQRAWWTDAVASILAIGVAQGVVVGAIRIIDGGQESGPGRAVISDVALVLERPAGFDPTDALTPLSVTLDGSVAGLYPGAEVGLLIEIRNPTDVGVRLEVLHVSVGTPDRDGCPASALLVGSDRESGGTRLDMPVELPAGTMRMLAIPVAMAIDADSACQGATFPLAYLAEGILP
jgi:hypothetical protein